MSRSRLLETVATNRCLLILLAVALILRLGLAAYVQHKVDQPPARLCLIPGDAEGYWELAQNIVAGKDFAIYQPPRYVLRVPGFSIVLAASQLVFGQNPFAARCLLACIGTATCGLTYWLGVELADRTTGLIATAYTALSPTLALFSVLILSETVFATTLLASLIAIVRINKSENSTTGFKTLVAPVTAGLLIGIATLVRPTWLYVGLAIAIAFVLLQRQNQSLGRLATHIVAIGCGVALCMAPWTIRNFYVTGHVVTTTLWVGPSLYDGLNPGATGDSNMQFVEDDQLMSRMSEYDMDREYRRRAWQFAFQHPRQSALLAIRKQQRYWSLVPNADQFRDVRLQIVVGLTAVPLLLFAAIGLWRSRRNWSLIAIAAGPVLLFAALHLLFVGSLRYRLPAEYPLAVLAAVGIVPVLTLFRLIPTSDRGHSSPPG